MDGEKAPGAVIAVQQVSPELSPAMSAESPVSSSAFSTDDRKAIVFSRAAFAFREKLDDVRSKKHASETSNLASKTTSPSYTSVPPAPVDPQELEEDGGEADRDTPEEALPRRIVILRCIQGILTSVVSLLIALFQGKAYVNYLQTKDVPGAWPKTPSLVPTLLLFSIAICALVFDCAMITAYLSHNPKRTRWAFSVARRAHVFATSAKAFSFALVAIVCKSGFDFGNASGQNNDLWSWTCSDKTTAPDATQSESNCQTQTVAWIFAILNAAIEVLGMAIQYLVRRNEKKKEDKEKKENEIPKTGKERREKLTGLQTEMDGLLSEAKPAEDS